MIEILILSLIQGIAEFLPISSSSHLILISEFLNFENQSLSVDVSLHIGSFLAVIIYFRNDLKKIFKNKTTFYKILLSSLPVMVAGFFLVEFDIITKIRNIETIAWTTLVFGFLLFISDKFKTKKNIYDHFDYKSVLLIGFMQILSLVPGVSRSGIAITTARFLKFKRTEAAKISFLISIPILGAVSIFGLKNLLLSESIEFTKFNLLSIFISFIFSFLTIKFFLKYIERFNLNLFVFYRISLGLILIFSAYL